MGSGTRSMEKGKEESTGKENCYFRFGKRVQIIRNGDRGGRGRGAGSRNTAV